MIVSFLNQKGGVGKSALARTFAVEIAKNSLNVCIADLDTQQRTAFDWTVRRAQASIEPAIDVSVVPNVKDILELAGSYDLVVVDSKAFASEQTLEIAKISNLVVIPTSPTIDELKPTLLLAQELESRGIDKSRIFIVVNRAGSSTEARLARATITDTQWGFSTPQHALPFRTLYGTAMDKGRALTETKHQKLDRLGELVTQAIADKLMEVN